MTETEFLEHLRKKLHVLKENERDDILSEYAQHIELKMESGLSEAEAIGDFGNLDELAAEILDAYHVNPDYNKRAVSIDKSTISRKLTAAGGKIGGLWRRWAAQTASLIHGGPESRFRVFFKCCLVLIALFLIYLPLLLLDLYIGDLLYRFLDSPFDDLASIGVILGFHLCYLAFAIFVFYNLMWKHRGQAIHISELGQWIKHVFVLPNFSTRERTTKTGRTGYYMKTLWNIIRTGLIWAGKVIVLCILAPILLVTLLLLVAFGTLTVLSVIGYPVIGLTILSLGGLLGGSAFLFLVCRLLFSKKAKHGILVFFAGLLLMGVGGGVAFGEFSTFRYGGEKHLNGELTEVNLQKRLPEDVQNLTLSVRRFDLSSVRLEPDSSLADNQISIQVLCQKDIITPYIVEETDQPETVYALNYAFHNSDDGLSKFFQVKDILLEGLKNRVVYSYHDDYIMEVVVKAPPELADRILIE